MSARVLDLETRLAAKRLRDERARLCGLCGGDGEVTAPDPNDFPALCPACDGTGKSNDGGDES